MSYLACASSLLRSTCVVVLLAMARAAAASIGDDFGDGDDSSPPWSHFDPTLGATFDASSLAYLIGVDPTGDALDPARALSLREDASFGDVVVAADLVDFDGVADHRYGLVARGTSTAAATHDGYALVVSAPGTLALLQIDDQVATLLASSPVLLSAGVDYRLVLEVTGTGPALLTGTLFAASDLEHPVARIRYGDSLAPIYAAGFAGLRVEDAGALQDQALAASFDAFFAGDPGADGDADGLGDGTELAIGTDPSDSDSDDDGLLDGEEFGTGVFDTPFVISTVADGARSVFAADVDGDGDTDALSASFLDDTIAWHENDGTPLAGAWPEHVISTAADGARAVFAADVDGDGDTDVLSASSLDDKLAWYENDGTPAVDLWTEHVIADDANEAGSVSAFDVDGDGDLDVVSNSLAVEAFAWYENDGTPALDAWTRHLIGTGAAALAPADVDGDGDTDLLNASFFNYVSWYENDGTPAVGAWPEHELTPNAANPRWISAADFDGDGDTDVLSRSASDFVAWYENDGTPATGPWAAHAISAGANTASSTFAADVDGDGDTDVLATLEVGSEVVWYENDGTPALDAWSALPITTAVALPLSVVAADVDGDGDADALSASFFDDKIAWYAQQNVADPLDPDSDDDGLLDGFEVTYGFDPLLAGEQGQDPDADGLVNLEEQTAGSNPTLADTDADGLLDGAELNTHGTSPILPDTDGDGLLDGFELANGFDPLVAGEQGQDPDADGLTNLQEQTAGTNPAVADTDGDGLLDGFEVANDFDPLVGGEQDADPDADGLTNLQEQVAGTNPNLPDTDGDGLGDGAELNLHGTSPILADTDGDGLLDGFELANGFDPLAAGEQGQDPDADGLTNLEEQTAGTNPTVSDTDADGLLDGFEVTYGFDPLVAGEQDQDPDADGLTNLEEQTAGTDPSLFDTDADGLGDGAELDVYGTDPTLADSDGDTALDGSDNCPITANPTQSDVGGLSGEPADGIGDACQCGDVDDDGIVGPADVEAYRDSLADPDGLPLTPAGVAKCSVIESAAPCEILDVTVIQRALELPPLLPGVAQVCSAARAP
ncbi:MAG: FG-GAP-like repeat-containing protein [Myxococcota bacterium]